MQLDDYLTLLDFEADLFSTAIIATDPAAPIPTCPGWDMRDLVLHQGEVHRWATAVVRDAIVDPSALPDDLVGPLPDDDALADWFAIGVDALLASLRSADPALRCLTFLADPLPPVAFWARRQTHETGMHRVDAESAGGSISPFSALAAADGIDEMLTGFVPRPSSRLRSPQDVTLQIETTDTGDAWHLTIGEQAPVAVRDRLPADCTVSGRAADLHPALWHRPSAPLAVAGDAALFDHFLASVAITWS
jgi:uncharacterized protein (TIGR03083 family)